MRACAWVRLCICACACIWIGNVPYVVRDIQPEMALKVILLKSMVQQHTHTHKHKHKHARTHTHTHTHRDAAHTQIELGI